MINSVLTGYICGKLAKRTGTLRSETVCQSNIGFVSVTEAGSNRMFSCDVTAAMSVSLNKETAAMLVSLNKETAAMLVSLNKETAAILMSSTNPSEIELCSYANVFFRLVE